MKKTDIFAAVLVCIFAVEMVNSAGIQENLKENLVRLHIIANSDTARDQKIKLAVRDALLKAGDYDVGALLKCANDTAERENAGYSAQVSYRTRYVPPKCYKNIALPEGEYTCMDVILGEGKGENWWCIAYPPLCFTEAVTGEMSEKAKRELKARLSSESLNTILKNEDVTLKFKIVEDFQRIMKFLE